MYKQIAKISARELSDMIGRDHDMLPEKVQFPCHVHKQCPRKWGRENLAFGKRNVFTLLRKYTHERTLTYAEHKYIVLAVFTR